MANPIRSDVIDAIQAKGHGVSYRGFVDSQNHKRLAIDPVADELETVLAFVRATFPDLTTEVISCEPYQALRRIIVGGF
jgi:hypothetical protein